MSVKLSIEWFSNLERRINIERIQYTVAVANFANKSLLTAKYTGVNVFSSEHDDLPQLLGQDAFRNSL